MKLRLKDNGFTMEVYFKYHNKRYTNYKENYGSNILLDKNNNFVLTLNFADSENEGFFKEITTIYSRNRKRLKTIMDASLKKATKQWEYTDDFW